MREPEGYGEEPAGGQEVAREKRERGRRLRAQAELAWARVQRTVHKPGGSILSAERVLAEADRLSTEGYLGGIAGSFIASVCLDAAGHRKSAAWVGLAAPLAFALGFYAKLLRRRRQR